MSPGVPRVRGDWEEAAAKGGLGTAYPLLEKVGNHLGKRGEDRCTASLRSLSCFEAPLLQPDEVLPCGNDTVGKASQKALAINFL